MLQATAQLPAAFFDPLIRTSGIILRDSSSPWPLRFQAYRNDMPKNTYQLQYDHYPFFANGQQLITIEDDTLSKGKVGLDVDISEAGQTAVVEFDNLVIRQIE